MCAGQEWEREALMEALLGTFKGHVQATGQPPRPSVAKRARMRTHMACARTRHAHAQGWQLTPASACAAAARGRNLVAFLGEGRGAAPFVPRCEDRMRAVFAGESLLKAVVELSANCAHTQQHHTAPR